MTLPAVALVLLLVVQVGGVAAAVVRAQGTARDAARAAVLEVPYTPPADTTVTVRRTGDHVEATVRLPGRWAAQLATDPVVARAVMVAEP